MMDWNSFGVVAALAWGGLLLAFCVRGIVSRRGAEPQRRLGSGGNPPGPLGEVSQKTPRLCASARDKNTWTALLLFAAIATVEAQKPTNNVPPNLNAPLAQMQQGEGFSLTGLGGVGEISSSWRIDNSALQLQLNAPTPSPVQTTVPDADIARGYYLVEEDDSAAAILIPTNAVTVGNWHLHGARSSIGNHRLDLAPWSFPLGTNRAAFSSFWYFVEGKLRPTPRDAAHEICAVGAPMLAVPGESGLWLAAGDDDSRTLVWDNFFLNGDTNAPVTAQIQLWPDGDFATQSNNLRRVYARINPDDWDGDGLANEIDLAPTSCDGDFYGTGVAWLNANCGNVLLAATNALGEIEIAWNAGVCTNAYYWLTFTSLSDKNFVSIACDGPSNLGDLSVVAHSNQVCRVPLLVGAHYAVRAGAPLDGISASDENAEIFYNDSPQPLRGAGGGGGPSANFDVRNPLMVSFEDDGEGFCVLATEPINVDAVLTNVVGGCCPPILETNGFRWVCAADCGCSGGEHSFEVYVTYEGYMLYQWWWGWCDCRDEGDDIAELGRLSLEMPDTLFENTDNDVVTNEFFNDFGSQIVAGEDDLGHARLCLSSGSDGGVLRYVGTAGFVGDVYEGSSAENALPDGTEWESQSGEGILKNLWIDASLVSPHYRRGRLTASWTPDGGATATVSKRFTVVRPVVEPICTETKSVAVDGVTHSYVYNPCGVGVGKDAYFKIAVTPADYPDEKIVWTNTAPGAVEFIDGNTGREVHVRGLAPGWAQLRVQIGDAPSDPPQFPLHVVTNRVLHLTAWIASDGRRVARDESEVQSMIPFVNDVFAQIGVEVVLDGVVAIANSAAYKVYINSETGTESNLGLEELRSLASSASEVNCFFIDSFVESDDPAIAVHWQNAIVMTRVASGLVLAHELGHHLGAADIYVSNGKGSMWVDSYRFRYDHAPDDWSNGCINANPGYYERDMTCGEIIGRLLMNGRGTSGRDMTAGPVWGIRKVSQDNYERGDAAIGFFH